MDSVEKKINGGSGVTGCETWNTKTREYVIAQCFVV